jgi:cell division protein FtsW
MLAAVLKIGSRAGGAVRWFRLGPLSFQPSELAKFALCVYLATLLARKAEEVKDFKMGFLPPLLVTGVMMGLLLKQPDLGTAFIFGAVALGLLFVAGTRTSYLIMAVLVAAPIGWKFIVSTPFRMRRMLAFLDPWAFRRDVGYQITESLISVGSGGVTGLGLGDGRQKLFFLPEAHTDFILSIVGEELGLVGIGMVIGLFGMLVWRGLRAAVRARDAFGCYLAFGITAMFALQALVNIGVVLGSLPTKGLPLPFVSYGGTSLLVSLFMAGVLGNISARNPEPREWQWPGGRGPRDGGGGNRRVDQGFELVIDVGKRRRR